MAAGDLTATLGQQNDHGTSFDGADDYIQVAHSSVHLGTNFASGYSISCWIKAHTLGENNAGKIIDKSAGTTGQDGFSALIFTSGGGFKLSYYQNGSGKNGATALDFNTWYHVVFTISSAQLLNVYVNGSLDSVANQDLVQTISTITTTNVLRIGNRSQATDRTWDGHIRDVKIFTKELSAAEVSTLYSTGKAPSMLNHWKLLDDALDYQGENDGTISGAVQLGNSSAADIVEGIDSLNLALTSDNCFVLPVYGRNDKFHMICVCREAP